MIPRIGRLLPLVFLTAIACSRGDTNPATYPVVGVVTQGGNPVAGAVVSFYPTAADYSPLPADAKGVGGQATTGDDGSYAIESTFDMGKTSAQGLPAGAYLVTVVKMDAGPGPASITTPPKNILDPRYGSVDTTPIKVTITANGENKLDIPL